MTKIIQTQQQLIHHLVVVITGLSGVVVAVSIAPFIHSPNNKITSEVINTFFRQSALPLPSERSNDWSKSIIRNQIIGEGSCCSMKWIDISHCYLKISNSLLTVAILLVYSISDPKNMLTALLPSQVNPRSLSIENHIATGHICEKKVWFSLSQM